MMITHSVFRRQQSDYYLLLFIKCITVRAELMKKATKVHTFVDHEENKKRLIRFYNRLENHLASLKTTHQLVRCTTIDEITKRTKEGVYCIEKNALNCINAPLDGIDRMFEGTFDNSSYKYCAIDWATLSNDIRIYIGQCYGQFDDSYELPEILQLEVNRERDHLEESALFALAQDRLVAYQAENELPRVHGKWRKDPYPPRSYRPLDDYKITDSISADEAVAVRRQLSSSLSPGFKGPALECDDVAQMEAWMRRFKDKGGKRFADDDTINRLLVEYTLDNMVSTVQHRAYNDDGVVTKDPIDLGPQLKEALVWGIDCYTRRLIELALEDTCAMDFPHKPLEKDNSPVLIAAQQFIEQTLLPCMNTQTPENAHDMDFALMEIASNSLYSMEHRKFATIVRLVKNTLGDDQFRIYPKGTGVICTNRQGICPDVFVSKYLGEIYPPYRWCEKLDVLRKTQNMYGLKPALPDFYNILLEKHRSNSDGYGMLFVDASQFANMGSSCSHSCDANCTSSVVVRNGKHVIALTSNRAIRYGEELTMDYCSVTSSEDEWRTAICLCGMKNCRGSFLHFSTRNDLQQVLNRFCSPVYRFAALAHACTDVPIDELSAAAFVEYGILDGALGKNCPLWMRKFAFENIKFIEYERRSLPSALLRSTLEEAKDLDASALNSADSDAHSVMESRIQAVVISFSIVRHLLSRQPDHSKSKKPIRRYFESEACHLVHRVIQTIPDLLFQYYIKNESEAVPKLSGRSKIITAAPAHPSKKKSRIVKAISDIRKALKGRSVDAMWKLSKQILDIRNIIKALVDVAMPTARLQQLSDILVLWAHTANFLTVEKYSAVECDPVKVFARELGNNIPRSKILNDRGDAGIKACGSKRKGGKIKQDKECTERRLAEGTSSSSLSSVGQAHDSEIADLDGMSAAISAKSSEILDPNEIVYDGTVSYNNMYIFWQLMGWFNAGTDDLIESPDVMGTLQLPLPVQCFGVAESNYGSYDRRVFLRHVLDEFKQSAPWPSSIKKTFASIPDNVPTDLAYLMGSPFLDNIFGVGKVTKRLSEYFEVSAVGDDLFGTELQYDTMLPPEISNCSWVSCVACRKWRRLAWYMDPKELPEVWRCDMNTWDKEKASCDAVGDYDPELEDCGEPLDEEEAVGAYLSLLPIIKSCDECPVGVKKDVFCTRNKVWYKAKILAHMTSGGDMQADSVRVHFLKWRSKFDEVVPLNSGRIQEFGTFSSINNGVIYFDEPDQNSLRREKRGKLTNLAGENAPVAKRMVKKKAKPKQRCSLSADYVLPDMIASRVTKRRLKSRPNGKNQAASNGADANISQSRKKKCDEIEKVGNTINLAEHLYARPAAENVVSRSSKKRRRRPSKIENEVMQCSEYSQCRNIENISSDITPEEQIDEHMGKRNKGNVTDATVVASSDVDTVSNNKQQHNDNGDLVMEVIGNKEICSSPCITLNDIDAPGPHSTAIHEKTKNEESFNVLLGPATVPSHSENHDSVTCSENMTDFMDPLQRSVLSSNHSSGSEKCTERVVFNAATENSQFTPSNYEAMGQITAYMNRDDMYMGQLPTFRPQLSFNRHGDCNPQLSMLPMPLGLPFPHGYYPATALNYNLCQAQHHGMLPTYSLLMQQHQQMVPPRMTCWSNATMASPGPSNARPDAVGNSLLKMQQQEPPPL